MKFQRFIPRSSGALTFAFLCLLASGVVRLADPEMALAAEISALASHKNDQNNMPATAKPVVCTKPPYVSRMLAVIRARQDQLTEDRKRLANRMQALSVAEKKLAENTKTLTQAEAKLAATLAIADSAAEKDLQRLTTMYENMKPKNAAALFGAMAPEFSAGFLARMRPVSAAQILSSLKPTTAYQISLILAGRNVGAPKE